MYTLDIQYLGNIEPQYQQPLFQTESESEALEAFKNCPGTCALKDEPRFKVCPVCKQDRPSFYFDDDMDVCYKCA